MRLEDILEIGEAGPLPLVGIGLFTFAAPYFVPSLRPQMAGLLKASAKLFLEAELGADNELTDRLVDASVDCLMRIVPHGTDDERRRRADHQLDHFFSKARAASHRRGHGHDDARRRYHKHLSKMERALKSKREGARPEHRQAFDHAMHRVSNERRAIEAKHQPESPRATSKSRKYAKKG
jgi:hypothetical protein